MAQSVTFCLPEGYSSNNMDAIICSLMVILLFGLDLSRDGNMHVYSVSFIMVSYCMDFNSIQPLHIISFFAIISKNSEL